MTRAAIQPAPVVPLLVAMRGLQAALDGFDRDMAAVLEVGRSDAQCLRLLVEQGPASPRAIMRALGLTSGSVTALLDRLEADGLVTRSPDPKDRRALVVEPTTAGRMALAQVAAPLLELTAKLSGRLGEERGATLVRQLDDLARLVDWAGRSAR